MAKKTHDRKNSVAGAEQTRIYFQRVRYRLSLGLGLLLRRGYGGTEECTRRTRGPKWEGTERQTRGRIGRHYWTPDRIDRQGNECKENGLRTHIKGLSKRAKKPLGNRQRNIQLTWGNACEVLQTDGRQPRGTFQSRLSVGPGFVCELLDEGTHSLYG